MTLKDMEDVLEVREALDELAVSLACEKISEEQRMRLQKVKEEFELSTKSNNIKKIAEADVAFHDIIYEAADNPKLVSILNNLREQVYRYRVEYLKEPGSYPILIEEHEAIVEGLMSGNRELATKAMHEHVQNQAMAVKAVIEQQE